MHPRNVCLTLEYDGTPFVGWQTQEGLPTVQGHLQAALCNITHEPQLILMCAGRTDGGVHAYAQRVNFFTRWARETRRLTPALNHHLPNTIRVHRAEDVPTDFDARQSAKSKRYRYRVYNGPHPPALDRRRAWHIRRPLDVDAMQQAAALLLGEHDFNAFRSAHCDAAHAVRHMFAIEFVKVPRPPVGHFVDVVFHANAFCRHMCRIFAGTLVEVGTGCRTVASVAHALAARDRAAAGVTAPPWGLTLMEVYYPEACMAV